MRRLLCLILVSVALAGCGGGDTPLAHALRALRAGDHADFLVARQEAQDDLKNAIQPGGDLCMVTGGDIARYHAVYAIAKLDDASVFVLPEEDRLLFALKHAGRHSIIHQDTPIGDAPIGKIGSGEQDTRCAGKKDQVMAAMVAGGSFMQEDDEARSAVLEGWIDELKKKYGDKFADQMRSASNHLSAQGYTVQWPPPTDFASGRGL